jgi:hypothetical protein
VKVADFRFTDRGKIVVVRLKRAWRVSATPRLVHATTVG